MKKIRRTVITEGGAGITTLHRCLNGMSLHRYASASLASNFYSSRILLILHQMEQIWCQNERKNGKFLDYCRHQPSNRRNWKNRVFLTFFKRIRAINGMFTVTRGWFDGSLQWLDQNNQWSSQWREPSLGLIFTVNIQWLLILLQKLNKVLENAIFPVVSVARSVLAVVKKISVFPVILTPNLFHLV